jgi:hypothetical protein
MTAVGMLAIAARRELHRLQIEGRHAGCDIQSGLPLHADRLQGIGILRAADQKIAAEADPDRGLAPTPP